GALLLLRPRRHAPGLRAAPVPRRRGGRARYSPFQDPQSPRSVRRRLARRRRAQGAGDLPPGADPMTSCELPGAPAPAPRHPVSRVRRFQGAAAPGAPFTWAGVAAGDYKAPAAHHCGVTRTLLVGGAGERTSFHVRYFEVAPGGHTTLEVHAHEHAVVVL